jgi:hypothetical protein
VDGHVQAVGIGKLLGGAEYPATEPLSARRVIDSSKYMFGYGQ